MNRRLLLLVVLGSAGLLTALMFWNSTRVTSADYLSSVVTIGTTTVRVRVPVTMAAQTKGLGGVTSLTNEEGMMWRYDTPRQVSFWMKGMRIPLDFIWIRDGAVIGITPDVQPPTEQNASLPIYQPPQAVDRVLEVRAGFAQANGVSVGMIVTER